MNFGEAAFALAQPSNALFALLAVGLLLALRWRGGLAVAFVAAVLLGVAGLTPLGQALLRPLEAAVPEGIAPAPPAAILVLGGFITDEVSPAEDDIAVSDSGERLLAAAVLARRWPAAKVVVTDGSTDPAQPSGAAAAGIALEALGVPRERIVLERRALSTWDNAVFTHALVAPQPGQTFLLVTSAWHMRRALKTFAAAGWTGLVPYPVDYRTTYPPLWRAVPGSLAQGLTLVDLAAREYAATFAYRLAGRFPAAP